MDKFPEIHNLDIPVTSKEIKLAMKKKIPTKEIPAPEGFTTAAAAAKSHQSCPTLCNPIDGSPPGSPIPRMLQTKTLEWVAISFSNA